MLKLDQRDRDAQRRAAKRDQVHDGDRIELHGQHLHRDPAELLRFLPHDFLPRLIRLIDLQRDQPLQVLQKMIAQRSILSPITREQLLGERLHSSDGHRDQRHANQEHQRRLPVQRACHGK